MQAIRQRPDCDIESMFSAFLRVKKGLIMQKLINWKQVSKAVKDEL